MEHFNAGKEQPTSTQQLDPVAVFERMIKMEESALSFAQAYCEDDYSHDLPPHGDNQKTRGEKSPNSHQPSDFKLKLLELYYYGATT